MLFHIVISVVSLGLALAVLNEFKVL